MKQPHSSHILEAIKLLQMHKVKVKIPTWYKILDVTTAVALIALYVFLVIKLITWLAQ